MNKIIGHFKTITTHKWVVMKECFKIGLYKQGLLHDMSKYGFTEFIPMTFMHEYSPIFLEGQSNLGATGTQDLKLYAVSRLMLRDLIPNLQVSWVKMGFRFAQVVLTAGANDLGGTLGGDELSEASGAPDGVNASIETLSRMVEDLGRNPIERNSIYTEFYPID